MDDLVDGGMLLFMSYVRWFVYLEEAVTYTMKVAHIMKN